MSAIAISGDTAYLGGRFSEIGRRTGPGVGIDGADGQDLRLPQVGAGAAGSQVSAVIPDGSGGWYIGGSFTHVGGVPRRNAARILADGTVGAWDPDVSDVVSALARSGSTVYLGGTFSGAGAVNGTKARNYVAAVDATTGVATSWDPDVNGRVSALAVSGSTVYLGGDFNGPSAINGNVTRNYAAAVDATSGAATGWDPNAGSSVAALAVSGSTVYLGGDFNGPSAINGNVTRNYAAAVDATTGVATGWDPNANSTVSALAVSGSTVYLGGWFSGPDAINGNVARRNAAAVDATTGVATAWDPEMDDTVLSLVVSGSTVYAAGFFRTVGGAERQHLAALDATTGAVKAWDPRPDGPVVALAASGAKIYAGGLFTTINGVSRRNAAAVDLTTGQPTSWNPRVGGVDDAVSALAVSGSTVYVGGTFAGPGAVNGAVARDHLAAVDATTGAATAWDPRPDGPVSAVKASGSTVYAAGPFTHVNGAVPRKGVAAFSAGGAGTATAWDAGVTGGVNELAVTGSRVYLAGSLTKLGGVNRPGLGAVDATTGAVTGWAPVPNGPVSALAVSGSTVYLGGHFGAVNGAVRHNAAAVDAVSGAVTGWDPDFDDDVTTLAVSGSTVYAGGLFSGATAVNGTVARNRLAGVDAATGAVTGWQPEYLGQPYGLVAAGGYVAFGGVAGGFGDRGSFAVFGETPRFTTPPASQTVAPGEGATFTAVVSGAPAPALKWQVSTDGATFTDLAGETGPALTVPPATLAQSGWKYRAVASSFAGTTASAAAVLTVAVRATPPAPGPPPVPLPPAAGPRAVTPGAVKLLTRTVTLKGGIARVTLGCAGATPCTGTLRLTVPGAKGKAIKIVTARYAIAAGQRRTLRLRVGKASQRLLFQRRASRRATVALTPTRGRAVKATLTLKAATAAGKKPRR